MNAEIAAAMEKLKTAMETFPGGLEQCAPAIPVTVNGWESIHWHGGDFYAVELKKAGGKSMKLEPLIAQLHEFHQDNLLSWRSLYKQEHYVIFFNRFVEENVMVETNGNKVRMIKMPDDVLALRVSAGGNPIVRQFYCKYRGDINDIIDMLELLLDGARQAAAERGTFKPKHIILEP